MLNNSEYCHTYLKSSFTNIQGLRLNSTECESFHESNSPDILAYIRETWMTQMILAISLQGYSYA